MPSISVINLQNQKSDRESALKAQADAARQQARAQHEQSVAKLKEQAAKAASETKTQAEANRQQIRRAISQAEVEAQRQLQAARDAMAKAQKQRQVTGIGAGASKIKLPDIFAIEKLQGDLRQLKENVGKAEAAGLEDIDKQAKDIMADLDKQRAGIEADISQQVASGMKTIRSDYQNAMDVFSKTSQSSPVPAEERVVAVWGDDFVQLPPTVDQVEKLGAQNRYTGLVSKVNRDGSATIYPSYSAAIGKTAVKAQQKDPMILNYTQDQLKQMYGQQQKLSTWQKEIYNPDSHRKRLAVNSWQLNMN